MPLAEIIISDSSPLIALARTGQLHLLPKLAPRERVSVLLLDDLRARKLAARLNLRRMGTVALLAAAKRAGLIEKLKPQLEALVAHNIYLRQALIDAVLRDVWRVRKGPVGKARFSEFGLLLRQTPFWTGQTRSCVRRAAARLWRRAAVIK